MPTSIDSLQIDIIAQSNKADVAIDRLVSKLDKLSNSIGKIPTGNISSLASGVDKLGRAMQLMGNVDSRSFTRLANNINKLSQVDVASINNASSSIRRLATSFNVIGTASQNTQNVAQLASALGKLGGKSVTTAIVNLPLLTNEMNNLLNTLARSPQISRNVIDMTNALANLASRGRSVGTASKSLSNGLNGTHKSMFSARTSAFSLASAFGKLYANYFLVIRGAKAFVNAIKGTSDYIEAFNYYNVAFGKIADEWDKDWKKYGYNNAEAYADSFTERMQESLSKMSGLEVVIDADGKGLLTSTNLQNLGLNIREITQYASQLASVTNSVGQTGEVSLAAARSFTKLGADLSSLFNIDYSDAMANLQSGLIGQSRALYKYGIDITNATLQTYAFELGLSKSVSEMTQAEKMQLRMVAILDQSRIAWGDLANTINSPSNMLRQFTNNLNEVGMVLGQLFIPLMERVMPVVNGATIAIKNFLVNIASLLGIQIDFSAFGEGFSGLGEDTADLADGLDDLTDSAKRTNKQLGKFDELNNITLPSASSNGSGLGASIDLTEEIVKATEEYEKVWNKAFEKMESKAQDFADYISKAFKPISEPLNKFFRHLNMGGWTQAGEYAGETVTAIFDSASSALKEVDWDKIGKNIGLFLKGIKWKDVFRSVGNFISTAISSGVQLWKSTFDAEPLGALIVTGLAIAIRASKSKLLVDSLGTAFKNAIIGSAFAKSITTAFASVGGIGGLLTTDLAVILGAGTIAEIGLAIGTGLIGGIAGAIGGWNLGQLLYEKFSGEKIDMTWLEQFEAIKDSFSDGSWRGAIDLMWKDIESGLTNIAIGVSDWWEDTVSDIKKWLQELGFAIDGFYGSHVSSSGNEHGGGGNRPRYIPQYSVGGFPEDGLFMANRGELVGQFSNGRTAVANNEQITQGIADAVYPAVYNAVVSAMSSNSGNGSVTVEIDGREVFRTVQDYANRYTDRTRRPAFN